MIDNKRDKWIPEIFYEENANGVTRGLPFVNIPKDKVMPSSLFLCGVEEGESDSTDPRCSNIKCYHDYNNQTVNFQKINNWQNLNDDQRIEVLKKDGENNSNVTNRCDWIKCCGVSVGNSSTAQPWLEINDYCNSVSSIN